MSNSSKSQRGTARLEIKGALKSLNIAEPTRIPKEIEFRPPSLPQNKGAQLEAPQYELPRVEAPQIDEVAESNQIGGLHDLPQNEVAQIEIPQNQAPQMEVPRNDGASTGGFFPLTHGVFREPRLRKLSGDGFRVFLWLSSQAWRFPDSTGQLQASVSWISKETAVSEASVSRILGVLQSEKLLRRLKVDYQNGNVWHVEDLLRVPFWAEAGRVGFNKREKQPTHFEGPQNQVPQFGRPAPSKQGSSSVKMREQLPQNEGESIQGFNPVLVLDRIPG